MQMVGILSIGVGLTISVTLHYTGLNDMGEMWLNNYQQDLEVGDDFRDDLEEIWKQLEPFYVDLHAYVRWRYRQHWGEDKMPDPEAPIPAHLFGNMWAQNWQQTFKMVGFLE